MLSTKKIKNVDKNPEKKLINRFSTKSTFCCGKLFLIPHIGDRNLKKILYLLFGIFAVFGLTD